MSLKVAILGAGSIGTRHLKNCIQLGFRPDNIIVFDVFQGAVDKIRSSYKCAGTIDMESMWAFEPKLLVICTPTEKHIEIALDATSRGIHIFVEKPLSFNLDGCYELLDAVKLKGTFASVGANMRYHPGPAQVKKWIDEGKLGTKLSASIRSASYLPDWRPNTDYKKSYSADNNTGGVILDVIHEIDLALFWLGPAFLSAAQLHPALPIGLTTDGQANLLLTHENGTVSSLFLSFMQKKYERGGVVTGDQASAAWDWSESKAILFDASGAVMDEISWDKDTATNDMYLDQFDDLLESIKTHGRQANTSSLEAAIDALKVAIGAKNFGERPLMGMEDSTFMRRPLSGEPASAGNGTCALIQARMGSTRLPGKVLRELNGKPVLQWLVDAVQSCKTIDRLCILTSTKVTDDPIADYCAEHDIPYYRGSELDVLDRFYQASQLIRAAAYVRLTADCPMMHSEVIDATVSRFWTSGADYCSSIHVITFPDGNDVEVFTPAALRRAWKETTRPFDREHVTPYLRNRTDLFQQASITLAGFDVARTYRWSLDTNMDFEFMESFFKVVDPSVHGNYPQFLAAAEKHHALMSINESEGTRAQQGRLARIVSGPALYNHAKTLIPGGTQLLSKRPEMFLPDQWPAYFRKADGIKVFDLDGNKFFDFAYNGIGANILGAADPDVNAAVIKAIESGTSSTLNCPEEVHYAELILGLHPWAQAVRYARTGGEAMSLAVRIARAHTEKSIILFCGYHGWHDWYLAANRTAENALSSHLMGGLNALGVPKELAGTAFPFMYNDLASLKGLCEEYRGQIACIVMEPMRTAHPVDGFLSGVRSLANEENAVLIVDEITAGFRLNPGGQHLILGLEPDMAIFSKGASNGFCMSTVIGKKAVMTSAEGSFISSTYWTERIGPTAAIATIEKFVRVKAWEHIAKIGSLVLKGWQELGDKHGMQIHVGDHVALTHFDFEYDNAQEVKTLFVQLMLERGYLATISFYVTYAHTIADVQAYLQTVDEVFGILKEHITNGTVKDALRGPVAHSGFKRLTS